MLLLGPSICWRPYLLPIDDSGIAKGILDKIFRIIGKGDPIQWLTRAIMNEHIFKTMTDTEEIYCYDNEKGVYVTGQEWRIKGKNDKPWS